MTEPPANSPSNRCEISVIVCVKNGAATLVEQLDALAAQDFTGAWELLVVDNGSTDKTAAMTREWLASHTLNGCLVDGAGLIGVAAARHFGIGATSAPLIAFCDADDRVDPSWLREMVAALSKAEMVGGKLRLDRINDPRTVARRAPLHRDHPTPGMYGLRYVYGANVGIRREVYDALGGFDQRFVRAGEDVDLAWQVQLAGLTLGEGHDVIVDYRLRPDARSLLRQVRNYGFSEARLRAKYPKQIGPMNWRDEARQLAHLSKALALPKEHSREVAFFVLAQFLAFRWGLYRELLSARRSAHAE